jgi:hypothetical protein
MKQNLNKLTEFEAENSPNIVVRVTDDGEGNFDNNAECAVICINPTRKAFLLELREKLRTIKHSVNSVYDIRVWDYSPKFLSFSTLEENTGDDLSYKVGEKDMVQVNNEVFNDLRNNKVDHCLVDVVLVQVSEDGFLWTGVYKHTSIRFATAKIPFSLIETL